LYFLAESFELLSAAWNDIPHMSYSLLIDLFIHNEFLLASKDTEYLHNYPQTSNRKSDLGRMFPSTIGKAVKEFQYKKNKFWNKHPPAF
jgi:hypothetical protein